MNAPFKLDHLAITKAAETLQPETVALRRAIHAEPELGLQIPKTTAKVKAALSGLPLDLREGPSTSGILAVLKGAKPGRTVLVRGDMDGLPMPEDTDLPFKSVTGNTMHACGHDSHTAMLATAAKILSARRESLAGTVYFMFQPGEEGYHGARHMLSDGLIDPLPDAAFALHIMPNFQKGVFASRPGALMASTDDFEVVVRGRGGHASMPHDTVDPIPVAAEIVMAVQAMVTRRVSAFNPVVITFGKMAAGTTTNVIPETALLAGTIRSVSEHSRRIARESFERVCENIAAAHGARAEVALRAGYPVTENDAKAFAFAEETLKSAYGEHAVHTMASPVMGGEDFSYVLQKAPGAMLFIGAAPEGSDWRTACPCHSNKMVMDEAIMARGAAAYSLLAERFLAEGL